MAETKRKIQKEPAAVRLERLLFARRLAGTVCRKKTGYQRKFKNERAGGDAGSFHLAGCSRTGAGLSYVCGMCTCSRLGSSYGN